MAERIRLATRKVEKPWGQENLPAPFASSSGVRIGEIWFEPPPELATLLVKYIFTSEALSVQVHPSDRQTLAAGSGKAGKEECWLVTGAEPGARIGIGFTQAVDASTMRAAALDGSIEDLLRWYPASAGDFFYIPANTVHAIGGGVSLIEIQQNSDITYRLYDYGRARELHLDDGIAVARGTPYDESLYRRILPAEAVSLVDGPHFRLDRICGQPARAVRDRYRDGASLVVPLDGEVEIDGTAVLPGECGLIRNLERTNFERSGACLLAQSIHAEKN